MVARLPRRRGTRDPELDQRLLELIGSRTASPEDRDLLFEMVGTILRMAGDNVDRLNLKITNAALKEMRQAFRVFAPYRHTPKVTIFGSARTLPDDPLYVQARGLAAALADQGWMVVTGAGPGIMAAGAEGAGRDRSIGVNIRLPFEQEANPFIAADPKLVSMKYFFTRKLMLMKESAGFVVLPGGFGTLDETFELLTLLQTGKAAPAPLVFLEVPGGTYWKAFDRFVQEELVGRAVVDASDLLLFHVTADVDDAVGEILGFYRNYHSLRYVGSTLVIRLGAAPTPDEVAALNEQFGDIVVEGEITVTGPLPAEVADNDHVGRPRLALAFDRMHHGRLRALIDALNRLPSAPPVIATPDVDATEAAATPPDTGGEPAPVEPDPAVAELLGRVAGDDDEVAEAAAASLRALLAEGGLSDGQQHAVVSELCDQVLTSRSPGVRLALVEALAAASPFICFDLMLELLMEHRNEFDDDGRAALLRALGQMLEAADGRGPGRGPGLGAIALLLRLQDPRPALDVLALAAHRETAEAARAVRERVDAVVRRFDG